MKAQNRGAKNSSAGRSLAGGSRSGVAAGTSGSADPIHLSPRDQLDFLTALQALVDSCIPLQRCVELLPGLFPDGSPKYEVALRIRARVKVGDDIGTALRRSANDIPAYIPRAMTLAGEIGSLPRILGELVDNCRTRLETSRQVAGALVYPGFILGLLAAATIAMAAGQDAIAGAFQAVMDGDILRRNLRTLLACFAGLSLVGCVPFFTGMICLAAARFAPVRTQVLLDRVRLAVPLAGYFRRQHLLALFFSLLHILLSSGLTLEKSLGALKGATGSALFDSGIETMLRAIRQGARTSAAAEAAAVFPPLVITWLKTGDATGDLPGTVRELRTCLAARLADLQKKLSTLVEPVSIVIAGFLVIAFVILIVLPLLTSFGNLL